MKVRHICRLEELVVVTSFVSKVHILGYIIKCRLIVRSIAGNVHDIDCESKAYTMTKKKNPKLEYNNVLVGRGIVVRSKEKNSR